MKKELIERCKELFVGNSWLSITEKLGFLLNKILNCVFFQKRSSCYGYGTLTSRKNTHGQQSSVVLYSYFNRNVVWSFHGPLSESSQRSIGKNIDLKRASERHLSFQKMLQNAWRMTYCQMKHAQ